MAHHYFTTKEITDFGEAFDLFSKEGCGWIDICDVGTVLHSLGITPSADAKEWAIEISGSTEVIHFADFLILVHLHIDPQDDDDEVKVIKEAFSSLTEIYPGCTTRKSIADMYGNAAEVLQESRNPRIPDDDSVVMATDELISALSGVDIKRLWPKRSGSVRLPLPMHVVQAMYDL